MRDTLGRDVVTERRACRVLGQARNTQRRGASVADDEPHLVKRIVWMASEYGRYGYRRITALLRAEGWWVNHMLTAVENGGAGTVSRRSKMAAHNCAGLCEGRIGATAPITPPFRERHRSALRHGDVERDTA